MSAPRRTRAAACGAALGVVVVLVLGMAGTGLAAEDLGCRDVTYQEPGRSALDVDRLDPHRGDSGPDGVACDSLPRPGTGSAGNPATTPAAVPVPVHGQGSRCSDFGTQADAQAALERSADDLLDADDDGIACEQHFGTEGQQVAVHPEGGVSAGEAPRP